MSEFSWTLYVQQPTDKKPTILLAGTVFDEKTNYYREIDGVRHFAQTIDRLNHTVTYRVG